MEIHTVGDWWSFYFSTISNTNNCHLLTKLLADGLVAHSSLAQVLFMSGHVRFLPWLIVICVPHPHPVCGGQNSGSVTKYLFRSMTCKSTRNLYIASLWMTVNFIVSEQTYKFRFRYICLLYWNNMTNITCIEMVGHTSILRVHNFVIEEELHTWPVLTEEMTSVIQLCFLGVQLYGGQYTHYLSSIVLGLPYEVLPWGLGHVRTLCSLLCGAACSAAPSVLLQL